MTPDGVYRPRHGSTTLSGQPGQPPLRVTRSRTIKAIDKHPLDRVCFHLPGALADGSRVSHV